MDNFEFERAFVDALIDVIESRGLKHDVIAKAAWPWRKAAGRTWQSVRNDNPPQRLTLRDAFGMAKELNLSMSAVCGMVEGAAVRESIKKQHALPEKKETPQIEEHIAGGPIQSFGVGTGVETRTLGGKE